MPLEQTDGAIGAVPSRFFRKQLLDPDMFAWNVNSSQSWRESHDAQHAAASPAVRLPKFVQPDSDDLQ